MSETTKHRKVLSKFLKATINYTHCHTAAQKLGATTFPFVAFIALQSRGGSRNTTSSSSSTPSPILTVLSRHQGPSHPTDTDLPSSELGPTSPRALVEHIANTLLPRALPLLERLRAQHEHHLEQRRIVEAQNTAYELAAQRDTERIQAKMAEERRQKEEIEMQELKLAQEERERQRRAEEKAARDNNRLHWYRYARKTLLAPETKVASPKDTIRLGVRFADGKRVIRQFTPSDDLTTLYVFVASHLIPKNLPESEDPSSPPAGYEPGVAGITDDYWSFKLATSYPRQEIPWQSHVPLSSVQALHGGAQLVVESIPGHALIPGTKQESNGDSDYDTEEEE